MKRGVISKQLFNANVVLERKMLGLRHVLSLDAKLCIGCDICSVICPQETPKLASPVLKEGRLIQKPIPDFEAQSCTFCGECVVLCPSNAIEIEVNGKESIRVVEANVFPTLVKEIEIDVKKCDLSCNCVCQSKCPTKAIDVKIVEEGNGKQRIIEKVLVDRKLCIVCRKCTSACPFNAIRVTKPFSGFVRLNTSLCPDNCQVCLDACPSKAISSDKRLKPVVDEEFCIYCGACREACPKKAILFGRTGVLCTGVTSGAWIVALGKLTSRHSLIKRLDSKGRRRLREAAQGMNWF
jgi:4Fe-4S ferredoxin